VALGFVLPERLLTDWLVLIPVGALELGAALSMLLVQSVSGGQTEQETPRQTELSTQRQVQTRSETPQTAPTPAKPGQTDPDPDSPAPTTKRRLANVVRFVRANAGKVTASQRSMARQLGVSATRVNELLRELQATGWIELYTLRSGTTVALAGA
jgi:Winged helix-turn-helix DNA-binding